MKNFIFKEEMLKIDEFGVIIEKALLLNLLN